MARHFSNWLERFMEYASFGEAPLHMYFWTGVSTIAGALERKVWIHQGHFQWFPNFYVVLVAPPGIVSKSTTAGIGMNLLRQVPNIKFGPEIVTWQALTSAFKEAEETFVWQDMHHTQSPLTIESSEFGNLLDPKDKNMMDLLVTLWDGKSTKKQTKHSGTDDVTNPWINLIACTTPSWIAGNFPEYMIGGGLTSRMVFVYAEEKRQYVAYPGMHVPKDFAEVSTKLVEDLSDIMTTCTGPFRLTNEAIQFGEAWYQEHYTSKSANLDDSRFGGYIARKQTHIHKLAMVLSIAESSDMVITVEHLELAKTMVTDLEPDMAKVFSKIGKSEESFYVDRVIAYVRRMGKVPYQALFRMIYTQFPSMRNFEDIFAGCLRAGYMRVYQDKAGEQWVEAIYPGEEAATPSSSQQ